MYVQYLGFLLYCLFWSYSRRWHGLCVWNPSGNERQFVSVGQRCNTLLEFVFRKRSGGSELDICGSEQGPVERKLLDDRCSLACPGGSPALNSSRMSCVLFASLPVRFTSTPLWTQRDFSNKFHFPYRHSMHVHSLVFFFPPLCTKCCFSICTFCPYVIWK